MTAETIYYNYRKLWEEAYGPIPKDDQGRSYEIHHIDGDRANNDLSNLACMPIKEHYDTHYSQGDWGACQAILFRMGLEPDVLSERQSQITKQLYLEGRHPLQNPDAKMRVGDYQKSLFESNQHNFQKSFDKNQQILKDKFENGDHPWVQDEWKKEHRKKLDKSNRDRLSSGTHPFQDPDLRKRINKRTSELAKKRFADGTHHLLKQKCPASRKFECQETGIVMNKRGFTLKARKELLLDKWPHELIEI